MRTRTKAICIALYLIVGIVCSAYYSQRIPSPKDANEVKRMGYTMASVWSVPAWPVVLVFHAAIELTAPEEATND